MRACIRHIALAVVAVAVQGTLASAQIVRSVRIVSVDPGTVEAVTQSTVTVIAEVSPEPALIRSSMTLTRYDVGGRPIATLGTMNDDGHSGDAVAGDNRFTLRITLNEPTRAVMALRASAAYRGTLLRVHSPSASVYVAITEPADAARRSLAGLLRAGDRAAAQGRLGERLKAVNAFELFTGNDLAQLAVALETCVTETSMSELEVCVAPVMENGQTRNLRIISVKDAVGAWQVLGW